MSIPANPPVVKPYVPPVAPLATEATSASSETSRSPAGHDVHFRNNPRLTDMMVKGVFGFVDMYRGTKTPAQEPVKQTNLLQLVYTEYKTPINDALALLGGAAPAELRPFVGAFKTGLINHAGVNAYMNGSAFNPYSGVVNALGSAVSGLFSSAILFKGSHLRTGVDLLAKNMLSRMGNPKMAPAFFEPSSFVKSMLALAMNKFTSQLTKGMTIQRPGAAGDQMTSTDEKHAKRLLCGITYLCGIGALLGVPGIKEPLADLFVKKFQAESTYDELLKVESITTDPDMLKQIKAALPKAELAAARARNVRIETPQQVYAVGLAVALFGAITFTMNNADRESAENYARVNNQVKPENNNGN